MTSATIELICRRAGYHRPKPMTIRLLGAAAEHAQAIIQAGYRFEYEISPLGEACVTITNDDGDWRVECATIDRRSIRSAILRVIEAFEH